MIATSYFAADLAGMISDLPASFIVPTPAYFACDCSVSELSKEQTLLLTGNMQQLALRVVLPVSAIPTASTALVVNKRIVVTMPGRAAQNLAIETIDYSQDNVSVTIIGRDDNRA